MYGLMDSTSVLANNKEETIFITMVLQHDDEEESIQLRNRFIARLLEAGAR